VQVTLHVFLVLCPVVAASIASQGCAAKKPPSIGDSFESYVGKLRELGVRARPVQVAAGSVEASDPLLSAALLALKLSPSPREHRRVAERYRALQISDAAFDHYASACRLDPADFVCHEGLAQIWRDWGFPHLGLADASRAVYYAPTSPTAHNTLGTILAALGRGADARRAYERALALHKRADYALNNLCYLSMLEGKTRQAVDECQAALAIDPSFAAARNNLALAFAAGGEDQLAQREFRASGDSAAASYNFGLVLLAQGNYATAALAFDAASRARPGWRDAHARARQTRQLATRGAGRSP
jgi:tetratricopeptide (TPR) repeat protein